MQRPLRPKPRQNSPNFSGSVPEDGADQSLTFVNVTEAGDLDPGTSRTIRRHVQSEASRRVASRRDPGDTSRGSRQGVPVSSLSSHTRRFRLRPGGLLPVIRRRRVTNTETNERDESSDRTSLNRLGLSRVDPFGILPVPCSTRTDILMYYYHTTIVQASPLMMGARSSWFSMSIHDKAFLLVKLCHASSKLCASQQGTDSPESLAIKIEAIRMIQLRLHQNDISDATVSAVASMVCNESVHGSLSSIEVHRDGLVKMVELRGLHTFKNPSVRRLIAWADVQSASALSDVPKFSSLNIDIEGPSTTPQYPISRNLNILSGSPSIQNLNHAIVTAFEELQILNGFIDTGTGFSYSNSLSSSDAIYSIQWKLNAIYHEWRNDAHHIERSCALAGLLYVECFIRDVNPSSTVVARFSESLRTSLKETARIFQESLLVTSITTRAVDFWFWSLFLGGMIINISSKNGEGNWFADQLARFILCMEFTSWDSVESKLQTVCYSILKLRGPGRAFWQKVQSHFDLEKSLSFASI